jgi:type I restriction enzyme M protein
MNPSSDLVNKLWRLCALLRKDGITYQQYVTELTYLLFLKMMAEQKKEENRIPQGMRWRDLVAAEGIKQLALYRTILADLGNPEKKLDRTVQEIFAGASTFIREPVNLRSLVAAIDELHWFSDQLSCCRFCGHRDWVFHEAGGVRWDDAGSDGNSRSSRFG